MSKATLNQFVNFTSDPFAELDLEPSDTSFLSSFAAQQITKPTLFFNPEDVNPFSNNSTYQEDSVIQKMYDFVNQKKDIQNSQSANDITKSPFYLGNIIRGDYISPVTQMAEEQKKVLSSPVKTPKKSSVTPKKYKGYVLDQRGQVVSNTIDELAKTIPDIQNYKDLLLFMSHEESRWIPRAKNPGSSAYGLFQMTNATRKRFLPNVSKEAFGRDIKIQIESAYRYMKSLFSRKSATKLRQMGLNDRQILRLGWFGEKHMDEYANRNGNYEWDSYTRQKNGNKSLQYYVDKYAS